MDVGSTVWTAWASVSHGEVRCFVFPAEVVAVVDGVPVIKRGGAVRSLDTFETAFKTEAEAWAHCGKSLARQRDVIDAEIANAAAKAAAASVGEAVPA